MGKSPVFIIAEAGVNHNGDIGLAKRLIDAAKNAGADAVKFQTFIAKKSITHKAKKAEYQTQTTDNAESQLEMVQKLELNRADHHELMMYCKEKNILFLSTPFDLDSVTLLESLAIPFYKIPSGEIDNFPLLEAIASKQKPIFLSTGMCTLSDVEEALEVIYKTGNHKVTLLHCVTEYPAPFSDINLNAITTLRLAFQVPVGYSDHTDGIAISLAAVSLGATVIEKHLTLDKTMEGPDHLSSAEPEEFAEMVQSIRQIETALGDGLKKPAPCEIKNLAIVRKSIVAAKTLKIGDVLTLDNMEFKRPGTGISAKFTSHFLGKRLVKDLEEDDFMTWSHV